MERVKNDNEKKMEDAITENMIQRVIQEGKKMAKADFGKFSAIVAVIFSVGLWVIKSTWYAYMSGKFYVYKIDRCYINADNENIFLQIIQLVAILIMWFAINYVFYKIAVAADSSKFSWKRKIKIIGFWVIEMFISFVWVLISTHNELLKLVGRITIEKVIGLVIAFLIICAMINIYAIEFLIEKWWNGRKGKRANNQDSNVKIAKEKRIKDMFLPVIITVAVELVVIFATAYYLEYNKCSYKMIVVQSEMGVESECAVEQSKCEMYPVIYENEDCYIITRLCNENGKIRIDYDYQRIVEKYGYETIYIQNIYDLGRNDEF